METTSSTPPNVLASQPQVTESARALLTGLIDYAGLFPPAALSMEEAVANYDKYLRGSYSWMLGRFIVPVYRLNEFENALAQLPSQEKGDRYWELSAIAGKDAAAEVKHILEFNYRHERAGSSMRAAVESIELKGVAVEPTSNLIPLDMEAYFEIPLTWRGRSELEDVAKCRRRAKIRMGGETPQMFPSIADIDLFLELCKTHKIPFKATAGLHHAIRGQHRCTNQSNSPYAEMYGFLNLFLAAASTYGSKIPHAGILFLHARNGTDFHMDDDYAGCGGGQFLSLAQISAARREFAISFGSCSFTEPVEDLRALRLV